MTTPPLGGSPSRSERWLNVLRRRWLTNGGNQINLPVSASTTSLTVQLMNSETSPYGVIVVPSWNTTVWVNPKGANAFQVNFGTGAPGGGGTIDVATFRAEQN